MRTLETSFAVLALAAAMAAASASASARDSKTAIEERGARKGKAFGSVFQLIRFENDACDGSGNRNGTCYTAEECEDLGGTDSGSCAEGFGVCCTFTEGCGTSSSQNCTYFEENGASDGACNMEVCPCGDNICQYRLDFNTFVIDGPSTDTNDMFNVINGQAGTAGQDASTQTSCLVDTFQVTGGQSTPPTICGTNTGEHMYVDADENCNNLAFNFGAGGSTTRNFQIKITQYNCDFSNLAPSGCTQYFFGANTDVVESYNFNSGTGSHLANQNQAICVRRERGQCRICWSAVIAAQFDISGVTTATPITAEAMCCQYGADGMDATGYDCVQVPGAVTTADAITPSRICGRGMGLRAGGADNQSVCSTTTPFLLRFQSDGFEVTEAGISEGATAPNDRGFRLAYIQDSINC